MVGEIILGLVFATVCAVAWLSYLRERNTRQVYRECEDKYRDRVIVVSDTRWGWQDFVTNNVVPVLPDGAEVIWRRQAPMDIDAFWLRRLVVPPQPPYAFRLAEGQHSIVPLYEALFPLKLEGTAQEQYKQSVVAQELAVLASRPG
jgi:hypothetical protein